tara:strand:+ start:4284 stop:5138 length:855 start_codon:yes stop_codon:yes gene_type:complete
MNKNVAFIGVGYMGYGIALNLIKNNFNLKIIAHKNRKPIEKLIKQGADEKNNFDDLLKNIDCLFFCVTNTPIAINIAKEIYTKIKEHTLIIDITTHNKNGSLEMNKIFKKNNINYIECPVMGGPVQAEEGILGGIVGSSIDDFNSSKIYLEAFCKNYFYFGEVGMGAKAKLICNFLSLGTTTFVIETVKALEKLNIDLEKFYAVAKLGSGNSGALNRVLDNAIKGDYKGYIFSVNNVVKDFNYIHELVSDIPNAEKLAALSKSFYEDAKKKGFGDLLVSELIKK